MSSYQNKHKKTGRFLELVLLSLLNEGDYHGYRLKEKLEAFDFDEETPSLSTIYRRLNRMEDEGIVQSSLTQSSEGPKQKTYQITTKGLTELAIWIDLIKNRRKQIDRLIEKYEENK